MKNFQKISRKCIYREQKYCTYWQTRQENTTEKKTECHFIVCPLLYPELKNVQKPPEIKRDKAEIVFTVDDFENTSLNIQELIQDSQRDRREKEYDVVALKKKVKRMTCIACGESILDDKFTIIKDPTGVLIYLHSKGECQARINQLETIRKKWLETHTDKT
ncbi:MAG: hypothetical protein ACTSPG_05140 [Candidatus Hodarchaeales archaeon]